MPQQQGAKQWPRSSKTFPYFDAMMSDSGFEGAGVTLSNIAFQNWTNVDGCAKTRSAVSTNRMSPSSHPVHR